MDDRVESRTDSVKAAFNIVKNSLTLRRDDQILLIFDEAGREIAEAFIEACRVLRQKFLAVYAPYCFQLDIYSSRSIRNLFAQIEASGALINCVNESSETTNFRGAALGAAVKAAIQCVHMPGVTEELLVRSTLDLNLKRLDRNASGLATTLTLAEEVEIHTFSHKLNSDHVLRMRISGRSGHADGGIARPGHVINMPTGEAYIAPLEQSARGSIVINGSFPGCELSGGGEVILFFEKGVPNLERSHTGTSGKGDYCRTLLTDAQMQSPRYFQLGELGLGLNPTVRSASGLSILDEKALGSAHIAIGKNTLFGGNNRAPYHHDLVFYPSSISLDRKNLANEWHVPEQRLWDE